MTIPFCALLETLYKNFRILLEKVNGHTCPVKKKYDLRFTLKKHRRWWKGQKDFTSKTKKASDNYI